MEGGDIFRVSSARLSSSNIWRNTGMEVFSKPSIDADDEEALKWAALEKLPTNLRIRRGILTEDEGKSREIDIKNLGPVERKNLLERLLKIAEEGNENFLLKLKERIQRVGLDLPTIEVRFEHLSIDAQAMTLLLGPPSSGKTTLLLALAGKLQINPQFLQVLGRVTYNGHEMKEFVPQRTSAYISQHDNYVSAMEFSEAFQSFHIGRKLGDELAVPFNKEKSHPAALTTHVTVYESLQFSAWLRLPPEVGTATRKVLSTYQIYLPLREALVGLPGVSGLSTEQRKRLTIAVELVANPSIIFMDEPTSGLDARAANHLHCRL